VLAVVVVRSGAGRAPARAVSVVVAFRREAGRPAPDGAGRPAEV